MGKISSAVSLLGVCVLLTLSLGAWFGCGTLRQDAFRQGLWPFTPFPIEDRATRLAAIRDPAKYKPAIVWSERAYSLWTGGLNGIVEDAAGQPVEHALVSAARHDVPCGCVAPSDWTDAAGLFALHALAFGHYLVVANKQTEWYLPNRQPFQQVTLGPADRVKTLDIRLRE
jgi:hypothetical protein